MPDTSGLVTLVAYFGEIEVGQAFGTNVLTPGVTELTYEVGNIYEGPIKLRVTVDMDSNFELDLGTDWRGYYDGTTTSPIQDQENAAVVDVDGCIDEVDFGVAVCETDADCP